MKPKPLIDSILYRGRHSLPSKELCRKNETRRMDKLFLLSVQLQRVRNRNKLHKDNAY